MSCGKGSGRVLTLWPFGLMMSLSVLYSRYSMFYVFMVLVIFIFFPVKPKKKIQMLEFDNRSRATAQVTPGQHIQTVVNTRSRCIFVQYRSSYLSATCVHSACIHCKLCEFLDFFFFSTMKKYRLFQLFHGN